MARAYKCDICGRIFEGITDMQLILSRGLEKLLSFTLGIKITPESETADTYTKDCCPSCAKLFIDWYRHARAGLG